VPERRFAVTVMTNANAGALLGIEATDWVLERFLGLLPLAMTPRSLTPDQRAEYAGEYILPASGGTLWVRQEDESLRLEFLTTGQGEPEIDSPLRFVGDDLAVHDYMGVPVFTDFVRDGGRVAWIRFLGRMVLRAD
jgi:hypothetical protein